MDQKVVIILGAGASFDAQIPLLRGFVDAMDDLAVGEPLLQEAHKIRKEVLESYNCRANFDIRNIEDILSLLAVEAISNPTYEKYFQSFVKAIAQTIELLCKYRFHDPDEAEVWADKSDPYQSFWRTILKSRRGDPAVITFNYDLVLERALWNAFHCRHGIDPFPGAPGAQGCRLNYHNGLNVTIKTLHCNYEEPNHRTVQPGSRAFFGKDTDAVEKEISYLKLHGSLNWQKPGSKTPPAPLTKQVDNPFILPPVFNKVSSSNIGSVWAKALGVLREAKKIYIIGYSLPRSDIYMQYFLKSAIGPNSHLQEITVFDPILAAKSKAASQLRKRYKQCFSASFQDRINFSPLDGTGTVPDLKGFVLHMSKFIG